MKYHSDKPLPDIQKTKDDRGIEIDQVGICDLAFPITVKDRENKTQQVAAKITMSVGLPHHFKGTHMSRFVEILCAHQGEFTMTTLPEILHELREKLDAESAKIEVEFPYFLQRKAPVSGLEAPMDYQCAFIGETKNGEDDFILRVTVPVGTLCPCSKEISDYGAHNQRGFITMEVRTRKTPEGGWDFIWIEELVEFAEKACSVPLYPLLKRKDERFVTMQAYDHPIFVEDAVRNVAEFFRKEPKIISSTIKIINQESIHNHSAFAVVYQNQ